MNGFCAYQSEISLTKNCNYCVFLQYYFMKNFTLNKLGIILTVLLQLLLLSHLAKAQTAAVIIDPNNGTTAVNVAYSDADAGLQLSYITSGNGTFTLTMPLGVTYIPGSMTFVSSAGAVIAESNISNLEMPVFTISGATVGGNSVISYKIKANCATQGSASIGVDVGIGSNTDSGTISISILKASLTIDAHNAAVSYNRGGNGSSTTTITNGGNGKLDSLLYYFKKNGPLVTDSIKANGVLATYLYAVGDTLFYQLRSAHFPGGTLDNGESITITRYFHAPECGVNYTSFQSTYLANFGRNNSRCQSPTPLDFGQYNFNASTNGAPVIVVTQVALVRTASPCQTALVRYRISNNLSGNATYAELFNLRMSISGTIPANGYRVKSVKLVSNDSLLTYTNSNGQIALDNTNAVQGIDPDGAGVGLEDLDGDGFYDDLNPNQNFLIEVEWEYQNNPACSNNPALHIIRLNGNGKDFCNNDYNGSLLIIQNNLHATGVMLLNQSPVELGLGQLGTMQVQISRTAPNANYLGCESNQWSVRFALTNGMSVSDVRFDNTSVSYTVVSDTVVAIIPNGTANPFNCEIDFSVSPGTTPDGTRPRMILAYNCNTACPNSREDVACLDGPPIVIPTPGLCETGGGFISNSSIQRITTGFTDYTGTTRVALSALTPVTKKRALPCDSVLVTATGNVTAGTVISGGEPFYYQISYDLHNTVNSLFQWVGGTYTYSGSSAALPAPVYEANVGGKHYAIYRLGLFPAGATVDIKLFGIVLNASTLNGSLQGVNNFSNKFYNLDDGFSNPAPAGDTQYTCNSQALEFYLRSPRGAFSNEVYANGSPCKTWDYQLRFWYLRGITTTQLDYFPGEVRPIDILDSIVVTLPAYTSYVPGFDLLTVGGNPNDGGFPAGQFIGQSIGPPVINGNRLVWYNVGWYIPDDALNGGYRFRFRVKTDCNGPGSVCGNSVSVNIATGRYYGHTNVNSENPTCPTAFVRTPNGYNTFSTMPVLSVTNLSGTQNADQKEECFNIRIRNTCLAAPYGYIYFPSSGPSGTFNITAVTNTNTGVPYTVLQDPSGQWVKIGTLGGDVLLTICAEYSNCANPDIPYRISWGCDGFPVDLSKSGCSTLTGTLDLAPAPSGLQAQFIAQPVSPVALCDTLVYDFNTLSTLAGDLINPRLEVNVPTGMAIHKVQIEYPLNSGNFETVTPAGTTGLVTIPYGLHSAINDSLPGVVFEPTVNPRTARMRFSFLTDCNFTSGDRFQIRAKGEEPCGSPAIGNNVRVFSDPITVTGISQSYLALVNNLNIGADSIITCSNRNVSLDMVILNTSASPITLDPTLDSVNISFPQGIQYVAGSYNCSSTNCFLNPVMNAGTGNISLGVPPGIVVPGGGSITMSFNFDINALVDEGCGEPGEMVVNMIRSIPGVACATQPGGVCPNPIKFISGTSSISLVSQKANIQNLTGLVCRTAANTYSYNGGFTVAPGTIPAGQQLQVELYCLNTGTPTGAPVATNTINGPLDNTSGVIPFSGTFSTNCTGENFRIRISPLTNAGVNQCACSEVVKDLTLSNPTFTVSAGVACFGNVSVNLPLSNITNGGTQYRVDFDDAAISDITSNTAIPGTGILSVPIPSTLSLGTYTGTLTVINPITGCEGPVPFTFVVNENPTATITTPICLNGTGTIVGSGTAATLNPYTSSNATVATVSATGVITGLMAGNVFFTYTNNLGCKVEKSLVVSPLPTIVGGDVCVGSSITLAGSGTPAASNPYTSLHPAIASVTSAGVVSGLSAGLASIVYTDINGCQNTAIVNVIALPTLSGGQICAGETITVLGSGIPNSTNPYVSSNPAIATVSNVGLVTGISKGTATITFTNINNCQITAEVIVDSLPTIAPLAICIGDSSQLLYPGTPALVTPFSSSNPSVASIDDLGKIMALSVGSSIISFTNALGCTDTALVTVNALPTVTVAGASPVCEGQSIELSASGGVSYAWSGPAGFTSTDAQPTITNATLANAGTYSVNVTSIFGCEDTSSVIIAINEKPTIIINDTICNQQGTFYTVSYTANPGITVTSNIGTVTPMAIENIPAGTEVTIFFEQNGCTDSIKINQICNIPYGSLGDKLFADTDADGLQDVGESGIDGQKVYLLDGSGTVIDSTITAGGGLYLFDSLLTGNYQVQFSKPFGTSYSPATVGTDSTQDSNASSIGLSGIVSINTSLPAGHIGRDNLSVDAGVVTDYGSIGNRVFADTDADGLQDAGESGIDGLKVYLLNGSGTVIDSTLTAGGGLYLFDSLLTGNYQVQFSKPTGTSYSPATVGADTTQDSNASMAGLSGLVSINTSLPAGDIGRDNLSVDAGVVTDYGSIGNRVFADTDADGLQDASESGIDGLKVYLLNGSGTVIDSTLTAGGGLYLFDSLLTGNYQVQFSKPAGSIYSPAKSGTDTSLDSDASVLGLSDIIAINTNDVSKNNLSIDAGIVPLGSVGNYAWFDNNYSDTQDAGDSPLNNMKVYLLDGAGNVLDSTTTDATGFYQFDSLVAGQYQIKVEALSAFDFITPNVGTDDALDSDVDELGFSQVITLAPAFNDNSINTINNTLDFAVSFPLGTIGQVVWLDANENGLNDNNETVLQAVKVYLLDDNQQIIDSTLTNSLGEFLFDSLQSGTYYIKVELPSGYKFTAANSSGSDTNDSDVDPLSGISESVSINPIARGISQLNLTLAAGLIQLPPCPVGVNCMSATLQKN